MDRNGKGYAEARLDESILAVTVRVALTQAKGGKLKDGIWINLSTNNQQDFWQGWEGYGVLRVAGKLVEEETVVSLGMKLFPITNVGIDWPRRITSAH